MKSTLNLNPHAPISSRNNVPHCTSIEEVLSDNTSKEDFNESDDSDEGLDDFFPQGDPFLPSKQTLNFAKFEAIDLLEIFLLHLGCGKGLQYMPLFLPHLVATPYLM